MPILKNTNTNKGGGYSKNKKVKIKTDRESTNTYAKFKPLSSYKNEYGEVGVQRRKPLVNKNQP